MGEGDDVFRAHFIEVDDERGQNARDRPENKGGEYEVYKIIFQSGLFFRHTHYPSFGLWGTV